MNEGGLREGLAFVFCECGTVKELKIGLARASPNKQSKVAR